MESQTDNPETNDENDPADQCLFLLDDSAFDAFECVLDASPVGENERLQQLLKRPKRWDAPPENEKRQQAEL